MNPVKGLVEWWKQGREISAELREERRKEEAEQRRKKQEFEALHQGRLDKAAGVSSMQIVCHEDTWKFVELAVFPPIGYKIPFYGLVEMQHFPADRVERGKGGMVTVTLSGRHLVAVLTITRAIVAVGRNHFSTDVQRYAMADRVYVLLSEVVDEIDPDSSSGGIPQLVIDAGLVGDAED